MGEVFLIIVSCILTNRVQKMENLQQCLTNVAFISKVSWGKNQLLVPDIILYLIDPYFKPSFFGLNADYQVIQIHKGLQICRLKHIYVVCLDADTWLVHILSYYTINLYQSVSWIFVRCIFYCVINDWKQVSLCRTYTNVATIIVCCYSKYYYLEIKSIFFWWNKWLES